VPFVSWPLHRCTNLHFPEKFREILDVPQIPALVFVNLEKVYDRFSRGKLSGVLQKYGVDGHMLLAVKAVLSR